MPSEGGLYLPWHSAQWSLAPPSRLLSMSRHAGRAVCPAAALHDQSDQLRLAVRADLIKDVGEMRSCCRHSDAIPTRRCSHAIAFANARRTWFIGSSVPTTLTMDTDGAKTQITVNALKLGIASRSGIQCSWR